MWHSVSLGACVLSHFSHVWLFATPWTVVCQTPLSVGILRARILQWVAMPSSRIFLTQELNLCLLGLLHWQAGTLPWISPGKPIFYSKYDSLPAVITPVKWWWGTEHYMQREQQVQITWTWKESMKTCFLRLEKRDWKQQYCVRLPRAEDIGQWESE